MTIGGNRAIGGSGERGSRLTICVGVLLALNRMKLRDHAYQPSSRIERGVAADVTAMSRFRHGHQTTTA